ncbi:MAG TPA: phospho-N-acetylmuramoyl-pentapeptide-transferase [Candidatus Omnitrophota bacterium]|nr:MAG: Phospho-N-acetylmuramoyl-pentapeptide-transferase [Candidatus Omnitrophica bacterium ADurb.Bin314]HOE68109.1 phospho-N-acetylmuramoyl-pentapeptide-transferase [Candidatus Omnitrophota bacterium]HPW64946.1 phospho-N-acetylmuramoyl-pentapeptide-transferase [Candidatus Omnitrophota bacterium]HQB93989.1 phospho-N-acetylmuramoyl-pentapeptide-transferase [Candidatus Omnitrophota bacterium]
MFYFFHHLTDLSIVFNLFRYITFRSAGASITAFFLCLWFGPSCIAWLKRLKAVTDQKRAHAEAIHEFYKNKKDTPMMGGILIVASVIASVLLWGNLTNRFVWLMVVVTLWFGFVGCFDDWLKMRQGNASGLNSLAKLSGQVLVGLAIGVYLYFDPSFSKWLYVPLLKKAVLYLGIFFIPFVILVLAGSSNALNLTDGLDGLAIGCTMFTTTAFAVIAYVTGHADFASYLQIQYLPEAGELTVFCAALAGASAGFLWFNSYPAEVFMGDTGSLSIGGAIGTIAVLTKKEIVLVIIGGVFVWEALSVILQVASLKLAKKRIFLMSPFHHHLQRKGWPESKITVRLWIIAFILAIVGLSSLKVR